MRDPEGDQLYREYIGTLERVSAYLKSRGWTNRMDNPGQKHVWEKPDGSWASSWYDALIFQTMRVKK